MDEWGMTGIADLRNILKIQKRASRLKWYQIANETVEKKKEKKRTHLYKERL